MRLTAHHTRQSQSQTRNQATLRWINILLPSLHMLSYTSLHCLAFNKKQLEKPNRFYCTYVNTRLPDKMYALQSGWYHHIFNGSMFLSQNLPTVRIKQFKTLQLFGKLDYNSGYALKLLVYLRFACIYTYKCILFFYSGATTPVRQGLLIQDVSRSHTTTH